MIDESLTTTNTSVCDRYMTDRFLEQSEAQKMPKAKYTCHKAMRMGHEADSVDIQELHIRGRTAGGRIEINGGVMDGATMTVTFVKRHWWRFDHLERMKFDRKRFDKAIVSNLLEGENKKQAKAYEGCLSSALPKISDHELEEAFVKPAPIVMVKPMIECVIRASAAEDDAPEDMVDCVVEHILAHITNKDVAVLIESEDGDDAAVDRLFTQLGEAAGVACDEEPPPVS